MKFLFKSDFHLDFHINFTFNNEELVRRVKKYARDMFPEGEEKMPVLLGGDFANRNLFTIPFLEQVSELAEHVFVVFGNHDYYLETRKQSNKYYGSSLNRIIEIEEHFKDFENITFLKNFEVVEYKGLKIAGATNWYKVQTFDEMITFKMINDSHLIEGYSIAEAGNAEDEGFSKMPNVDIVLTHVVPVFTNSHKEKGIDCYLSERDTNKARHWFAGHIHEDISYELPTGCKLHTDANGYNDETHCSQHKFNIYEVEVI